MWGLNKFSVVWRLKFSGRRSAFYVLLKILHVCAQCFFWANQFAFISFSRHHHHHHVNLLAYTFRYFSVYLSSTELLFDRHIPFLTVLPHKQSPLANTTPKCFVQFQDLVDPGQHRLHLGVGDRAEAAPSWSVGDETHPLPL